MITSIQWLPKMYNLFINQVIISIYQLFFISISVYWAVWLFLLFISLFFHRCTFTSSFILFIIPFSFSFICHGSYIIYPSNILYYGWPHLCTITRKTNILDIEVFVSSRWEKKINGLHKSHTKTETVIIITIAVPL